MEINVPLFFSFRNYIFQGKSIRCVSYYTWNMDASGDMNVNFCLQTVTRIRPTQCHVQLTTYLVGLISIRSVEIKYIYLTWRHHNINRTSHSPAAFPEAMLLIGETVFNVIFWKYWFHRTFRTGPRSFKIYHMCFNIRLFSRFLHLNKTIL